MIEIKEAKYIKLGEKGEWEKLCLADGTLRLGYYEIPHALGVAGDREGIRSIYLSGGAKPSTASDHARQVLDFYRTGPETLWITFSDGFLWWCRARQDVEYLGADKILNPNGSCLRRTEGAWSNLSVTGKPLTMSGLSGRLTRVAGYRQTICDVRGPALEYLARKINGQVMPQVERAQAARNEISRSTEELIRLLTWQDFELFVDLVFAHGGWRRVSVLGGTQKTVDLELLHPLTGERGIVQVKARTDRMELEAYAESLTAHGADRCFYVYHSASGELEAPSPDITLLGVEALAESAVRSGLVDWLIEKTA